MLIQQADHDGGQQSRDADSAGACGRRLAGTRLACGFSRHTRAMASWEPGWGEMRECACPSKLHGNATRFSRWAGSAWRLEEQEQQRTWKA
uniref:Uncharacterized protein n=1 Tax=Triticum urartu TaxID=4572 RepID=A0A8R7QJJ3_TRIUA